MQFHRVKFRPERCRGRGPSIFLSCRYTGQHSRWNLPVSSEGRLEKQSPDLAFRWNCHLSNRSSPPNPRLAQPRCRLSRLLVTPRDVRRNKDKASDECARARLGVTSDLATRRGGLKCPRQMGQAVILPAWGGRSRWHSATTELRREDCAGAGKHRS